VGGQDAFADQGYWGEEIITAARRDRFIRNFKFTGAKIACVRTDSPFFGDIIPALKAVQAKVYGWKWPHLYPSTQNKDDDSFYWESEINIVTHLVSIGLDGYIFDIETGPEDSRQALRTRTNPTIGVTSVSLTGHSRRPNSRRASRKRSMTTTLLIFLD
jgi:hypothetical protein